MGITVLKWVWIWRPHGPYSMIYQVIYTQPWHKVRAQLQSLNTDEWARLKYKFLVDIDNRWRVGDREGMSLFRSLPLYLSFQANQQSTKWGITGGHIKLQKHYQKGHKGRRVRCLFIAYILCKHDHTICKAFWQMSTWLCFAWCSISI